MAVYYTALQNANSTHFINQYVMGTRTLNITFYWPMPVQFQYTRLLSFFERMANANPFINDETKVIVRDYDVLDVIDNGFEGYSPVSGVDIDEWRTWASNLIGDLRNQYEYFKEILVWNLIVDDGRGVYTTALRIGGSISSEQGDWEMWFETTKTDESIGQDDLDRVTLYCEVT